MPVEQEEPSLAQQVKDIMIGKDREDGTHIPGVLYEEIELKLVRPPPAAIMVEGLVRNFGFHPIRLEEARPKVVKLIGQIVQDPFLKSKGGGWSFLNLCMDRNEQQWAEHPTMEEFVCLCIGLKLASYCMPRSMWPMFPGEVPYIQFEG